MKSEQHGKRTSVVEVGSISPHGFWLFIRGRKAFVSFKHFPWFREASIRQITNVELPSPHHLYWPELDIDLAVESLDHPERYPLVSRVRPDRRPSSAAALAEPAPSYRAKRRSRRCAAAKG